jgi:hypothetical protein
MDDLSVNGGGDSGQMCPGLQAASEATLLYQGPAHTGGASLDPYHIHSTHSGLWH